MLREQSIERKSPLSGRVIGGIGEVPEFKPSGNDEQVTLRQDMDHLLYGKIRNDIVELLQASRAASARSVNALMTATYWEIGHRIVEFEQQGQERAEYGEALIKQLAEDLTRQFGRGFGAVNLSQMRRFYLEWPAQKIFQTPSEKSPALPEIASKFPLPWSAYVRLLSVAAVAPGPI